MATSGVLPLPTGGTLHAMPSWQQHCLAGRLLLPLLGCGSLPVECMQTASHVALMAACPAAPPALTSCWQALKHALVVCWTDEALGPKLLHGIEHAGGQRAMEAQSVALPPTAS